MDNNNNNNNNFNLAARRTVGPYTNDNFIEHYLDAGFGSLADFCKGLDRLFKDSQEEYIT